VESPIPVVVTGRRTVAADVVELTLCRRDRAPLPTWTPGSHIDLQIDERTIRQYSLCGPLDVPDEYRVAVLRQRDGRGGSLKVHDTLLVGSDVDIVAVRNTFTLEEAPGYTFVAGGVGITPFLSMIQAAERSGARFRLFYGGRSGRSMAYLPDLHAYENVTVVPEDEVGPLNVAEIVESVPTDWLVYACGPDGLLEALAVACTGGRALRVERFRTNPGTSRGGRPFMVELARSGLELDVPTEVSLLAVLQDAGIPVMTSCEEGTCGTCEVGVVGGAVDHRDSVLTDAERAANDCMMVCVSRSLTPRLVIDL
jgi:ferredoxin-NADP reductase